MCVCRYVLNFNIRIRLLYYLSVRLKAQSMPFTGFAFSVSVLFLFVVKMYRYSNSAKHLCSVLETNSGAGDDLLFT